MSACKICGIETDQPFHTCKRPIELAPVSGSVVARLQAEARGVDVDEWQEQDSSCLLCNAPMSLNPGCEWPDDPRLLLCWGCMSKVLAELLPPNDQAEARGPKTL